MTRTSSGRARALVLGPGVLCTLAYLATLVPGARETPGFHPPLDGWLQSAGYVLFAVAAVAGAVLHPGSPRFWALIVTAVVLRALGFVLFLAVVRTMDPQPYPSIADYAWLLSSVTLVVAMAVGVSRIAPAMSRPVALDAMIAVLASAGVALVILYPTLRRLSAPDVPSSAVTTNLAYPVLDVALVVGVIGLVVSLGNRLPAAGRLVLPGILGYAVVDAVFLFQVSRGTYHPGTWLAGVSLVATGLIAASVWWAPVLRQVQPRLGELRHSTLTVPIVFAVMCVGVFVYDSVEDVSTVALTAAALALLLAIYRGATTLQADRLMSTRVVRAVEDERLKLQRLVESSSDFIAIAGLDGRVQYLNPAGRDLVGLEPDSDVTRTSIRDFLTEEEHATWESVRRPAVMGRGHWEGESTLRGRDGEPIPVASSIFVMRHPVSGEPLAVAAVQRDISARLAAEQALADLAEQRQRLLDRLVEAEDQERARIAADVHDDSVQALAVVDLRLGLLRRRLGEPPEVVRAHVEQVQESVSLATGRLRELLFDLESPAEELPLASAVSDAAGHLFSGTGITWRVLDEGAPVLPRSVRVTAYRIVKEVLVNVLKHSRATRATIELANDPEAGGLLARVADDGVGFEPETHERELGHLGLMAMSDRATIAGGWLRIDSHPGAGTTVWLWLPAPLANPQWLEPT